MKTLGRLAALTAFATMAIAAPALAGTTTIEGESMSGGSVFSSSTASGGKAVLLQPPSTVSRTLTTVAAAKLVVVARGDQCAGAPQMRVTIDGAEAGTTSVTSTGWATYSFDASVLAGSHAVAVAFTNDYKAAGCNRALRVDYVRLQSIDTAATNPLKGGNLFVEPTSSAVETVAAWTSTRPLDAVLLNKVATRPQAKWFGDFSGPIYGAVAGYVATAATLGQVPTLVAYNIPKRDCGSYSAGGATSADAYKSWIRTFANAIGNARVIVVLEPDALPMLDCLPTTDRPVRYELLADAVNVLSAKPNVATYMDIGHSTWIPSNQAAGRLWKAGVAKARGFSLNVSNFNWSANEEAYGRDVSAQLGGKGFVVDTSRNGQGPAAGGEWCNPAGRGLGAAPAVAPATGADANLYVKRPGESDGACNGHPAAGVWDPEYALELARNAS